MDKYPEYYDVSDTLVKLDYDPTTDEVFAKSAGGADIPLGKILFDGYKISEEEFNREVERIKASR